MKSYSLSPSGLRGREEHDACMESSGIVGCATGFGFMDAFRVKSCSFTQSELEGREVPKPLQGPWSASEKPEVHVQASPGLYWPDPSSAQASLPARRARRHRLFDGKAYSDSPRDYMCQIPG